MRRYTPRHWHILPEDIQAEAKLMMEIGAHPIVARLLVQRGLDTPEKADLFLNPSLDRMHDPMLLPDIEPAITRIKRALHDNEKIMVHGDYDGDGLTSSALWVRFLRALGADVDVHIPHRKRDGYDIRIPFIESAREQGATLIITTDCGIQRIDEVEHARQYGIDVIITDHHTPNSNGELPRAVAVINPHRKDSRYPFPDLAGVGVAFKTCEALTVALGHKANQFRRKFLDLAAIGTVTDVMPLVDENRIIVRYGLELLQDTNKPGLRALLDVAGYPASRTLDATAVGFGIGPRLNAASRMDDAKLALDLLLTKEMETAESLARQLNELNNERKELQNRILEEVEAQLVQRDMADTRCVVLHGTGWTGGVVGIVASKVIDRYHRPCILIALDEETGTGKGSASSIHKFNMIEAIDQCGGLLDEYGGHAHAAGLSIRAENLEDFAMQMNRLATMQLSEEDLTPGLEVAMEVAPSQMCMAVLEQIATMAPFGSGNHAPLFVSRNAPIDRVEKMGKGEAAGRHLRLRVRAESVNYGDGIACPWFNQGHLADGLGEYSTLDICYRPEINEYNGKSRVQFMLEDIRPPEW